MCTVMPLHVVSAVESGAMNCPKLYCYAYNYWSHSSFVSTANPIASDVATDMVSLLLARAYGELLGSTSHYPLGHGFILVGLSAGPLMLTVYFLRYALIL